MVLRFSPLIWETIGQGRAGQGWAGLGLVAWNQFFSFFCISCEVLTYSLTFFFLIDEIRRCRSIDRCLMDICVKRKKKKEKSERLEVGKGVTSKFRVNNFSIFVLCMLDSKKYSWGVTVGLSSPGLIFLKKLIAKTIMPQFELWSNKSIN